MPEDRQAGEAAAAEARGDILDEIDGRIGHTIGVALAMGRAVMDVEGIGEGEPARPGIVPCAA